jgi:protein SCO1
VALPFTFHRSLGRIRFRRRQSRFIGRDVGIVEQLVPAIGPDIDPSSNEYPAIHGVTLFLINPEGKLQAILQPDKGVSDANTFNPDTVLRDYLAIRRYLC